MKREVLILFFILTVFQSYSQNRKYENIHFIIFKIYQTEFDLGVPFAEICLSDKNEDFIMNCMETDFGGYAYFHVNPHNYNIDSTYVRIRILQENTHNDFGKSIKIPLNQIELLKEFNLEYDLKIALTDYKVLNEKEYKKHRKKYGLLPNRGPAIIK